MSVGTSYNSPPFDFMRVLVVMAIVVLMTVGVGGLYFIYKTHLWGQEIRKSVR